MPYLQLDTPYSYSLEVKKRLAERLRRDLFAGTCSRTSTR